MIDLRRDEMCLDNADDQNVICAPVGDIGRRKVKVAEAVRTEV